MNYNKKWCGVKEQIDRVSARGGPVSGGQFSKNSQYPIPNIQHPFIVKWNYGLKGKGVFLIRSASDFAKTIKLHPANEWLVQEFVRAKYEYKVITIGYKALPIILKFKFNKKIGRVDFARHSLLSLEGGGQEGVEKVIEIAQKASKVLGRELAKVDILEDHKGQLYILEVNRFPGLDSFEKLTKFNAVKEFVKYLKM